VQLILPAPCAMASGSRIASSLRAASRSMSGSLYCFFPARKTCRWSLSQPNSTWITSWGRRVGVRAAILPESCGQDTGPRYDRSVYWAL
jgi:hypothetical protein